MPTMIDFLWHLRGSVALQSDNQGESALDGLERLLKKQHKPKGKRTPNSITFDAPLWQNLFTPNWLAMIIYDHGRFWVETRDGESDLLYDLRSLHVLIFCLFGSAMFFGAGFSSGGFFRGLIIGVGAFGWIYGMNILLAFARVPQLIRKTVCEG